jgi:transposase
LLYVCISAILFSMSKDYKYVWNKQRGRYNVNIDNPVYDPETKKTSHHYKLVGTATEKGGKITFGPSYKLSQRAEASADNISTTVQMGERLIIEKAVKRTGINPYLVKAFGRDDAQSILDLASYILCTGSPLSTSEYWMESHGKKIIPSERISELLHRLNEDAIHTFLGPWMAKHGTGKSLCYDISSVSSYAKHNHYIEWGFNRDREKLPQINIALLSAKTTDLPLWFSPLPGSMNDSRTLQETVIKLKKLNVAPSVFIMDRGFYSQENLDFVARNGIKFIIPVPQIVKWTHPLIQQTRSQMMSNVSGYIRKDNGTIIESVTHYTPLPDGSRAWLHIYHDDEIGMQSKQAFMRHYSECYDELQSGELVNAHKDFYKEFFELGYKTKNGQKIKAIKKPETYFDEHFFGYWCIYTNAEKDARTALEHYRERNGIEQLFDDLKNELDCQRIRVHSNSAMYGRLFIQFIALTLLTSIRKVIEEKGSSFSKYAKSYRDVLRRVAAFSMVKFKGRYKPVYTTPTKGAGLIFEAFEIDVPVSSDK